MAPGSRRNRLRVVRNVVGAVALVGSLLLGMVWIGWKAIALYPDVVSRWLSAGVGQRVSITSIEAQWEGASPRLTLHDVTLLDPRPGHDERALARFESLDVLVDPLASIRSKSFRPAAVTVRGASLMLIRHPDGSLDLQGIRDGPDDSKGSDALARLFLGHAQVSVRSSRLLWVDRSGAGSAVSIPRGRSAPAERRQTPAHRALGNHRESRLRPLRCNAGPRGRPPHSGLVR